MKITRRDFMRFSLIASLAAGLPILGREVAEAGDSPKCGLDVNSMKKDVLDRTQAIIYADDATADQAAAIDMFNRNGMPVVIAAITGRIGTPGYLTWEQLRRYQLRGNEIANHTDNHEHLLDLDQEGKVNAITTARGDFKMKGITGVSAFVPPYGEYDDSIIDILEKIDYTSNRQASIDDENNPFNNVVDFDPFNIKAISIKSDIEPSDINNWLRWAAADKVVAPFIIHKALPKLDKKLDEYQTTLSVIQSFITCAASLRRSGLLDIVVVRDALAKVNYCRNLAA